MLHADAGSAKPPNCEMMDDLFIVMAVLLNSNTASVSIHHLNFGKHGHFCESGKCDSPLWFKNVGLVIAEKAVTVKH